MGEWGRASEERINEIWKFVSNFESSNEISSFLRKLMYGNACEALVPPCVLDVVALAWKVHVACVDFVQHETQ